MAKRLIKAFEEGNLQKPKTALIVFAHPEPNSFNGALKNAAVETLKAEGYTIEVSDLYAMKFNPVADKHDFTGELQKPDRFSLESEKAAAYEQQRTAPDIAAEMEKLRKADLVIFQFPIFWLSVPAILKGWFDRVLVNGFAYGRGSWFSKGLMKGKRALLSLTTGAPAPMMSPKGIQGDINVILWPLQSGVLRFCGFDVLPPQVNFSVAYVEDSVRQQALANWRARLQGIGSEEPLQFGDLDMFDPAQGFALKEEHLQAEAGKPYGLSIGTHLGKKLPTGILYP